MCTDFVHIFCIENLLLVFYFFAIIQFLEVPALVATSGQGGFLNFWSKCFLKRESRKFLCNHVVFLLKVPLFSDMHGQGGFYEFSRKIRYTHTTNGILCRILSSIGVNWSTDRIRCFSSSGDSLFPDSYGEISKYTVANTEKSRKKKDDKEKRLFILLDIKSTQSSRISKKRKHMLPFFTLL